MKTVVSGKAKAEIEFSVTLTMTKDQAKALRAITEYGSSEFLKVFYEKLGTTGMKPNERSFHTLFNEIKEQLSPEIDKIEKTEKDIEGIMKRFSA